MLDRSGRRSNEPIHRNRRARGNVAVAQVALLLTVIAVTVLLVAPATEALATRPVGSDPPSASSAAGEVIPMLRPVGGSPQATESSNALGGQFAPSPAEVQRALHVVMTYALLLRSHFPMAWPGVSGGSFGPHDPSPAGDPGSPMSQVAFPVVVPGATATSSAVIIVEYDYLNLAEDICHVYDVLKAMGLLPSYEWADAFCRAVSTFSWWTTLEVDLILGTTVAAGCLVSDCLAEVWVVPDGIYLAALATGFV